MLASTQCRIRLSKFGVVFNTSSGQMQLSFSVVPRKYARLMSLSFTSNDKLANIITETSTLLVESTNSSINDVCASRLCLALEQSHEHILNVLHRSLPVPQSNAIALIPAPSISSVSSSAWGLVTPPIQARDQHQIFKKISIVVILRILLALSRLIPIQARFLELNLLSHLLIILIDCSRSAFGIVPINIGLYTFNNVAFKSFVSHNTVCISGSIRFLPNFLCIFFQSSSPRKST